MQTLCTGRMLPPPLQPLARLPRPTSAGRCFPQRPPRTDRRCALQNVNRPLLVGSAPRPPTRGSPIFRACHPVGQKRPPWTPSALVQTFVALRPFRSAFGSSARVGRPLPIAPCYPRLRPLIECVHRNEIAPLLHRFSPSARRSDRFRAGIDGGEPLDRLQVFSKEQDESPPAKNQLPFAGLQALTDDGLMRVGATL